MLITLTLLTSNAFADISADQPTVLITGSNRGIGFEFVNKYSAMGWNVIATARKPAKATALLELAKTRPNIIVEELDVTDYLRVDALADKYEDQPIDVLINNAAITPKYISAYRSVDGMDFDMARRSFEVNALAPVKIARSFMPHIQASNQKKLITISTKAATFSESPKRAIMYSYRASKTALNMFMYTLAFETADNGVILTLLSPGLVNTMGLIGKVMPGSISTDESVTNMINVIDSLTIEDNGKMLNHADRKVIAW